MYQMKLWIKLITVAVIASAVTVSSYDPARLLIFKITEPYFSYPIKFRNNELSIRNDSYGDGEFGAKRRNGRLHTGIDIQAPVGTPVFASKSGIAFCGNVPTGYGKYVMIYHPDGLVTQYSHLSAWCVYSTQGVRGGDLIGFVGKTGNARNKLIAPHLHFEIRKDGEALDPRKLLR